MIKRFGEFIDEGWASGSMQRAVGRNIRREDIPTTKEELRDIILKRMNTEGKKCDLNDIDVSRITDMSYLFCAEPDDTNEDEFCPDFKEFNGDISGWDVRNVTDMEHMFYGCSEFNRDISGWDVSMVWDMSFMFQGCAEFNQDLSEWRIYNVNYMDHMFYGCSEFTLAGKLEKWYGRMKEQVQTEKHYMFKGCPTKPSWYYI